MPRKHIRSRYLLWVLINTIFSKEAWLKVSIKDEVVHVFWMFFWAMVSLFMHLGLIMVGAWVAYEIPSIDHASSILDATLRKVCTEELIEARWPCTSTPSK